MNDEIYILKQNELPEWVVYPLSFRRIVSQRLYNITPWHIMPGERSLRQYQGLLERYPSRSLFPFAYRQDNDDVACWSKHSGERVFVIHDFASQGFEDEGAFDSVWSWFRMAVEETIHWE